MKFALAFCLLLSSCSEVAEVLTAASNGGGSAPAGGTPSAGSAGLGGASAGSGGVSGAGGDGPVVDLELELSLSAGQKHTCLARDGLVYCWGENRDGQLGTGDVERRLVPTLVSGAQNVARVSVGESHTCWLQKDGAVSCFGSNHYGQLGHGPGSSSLVPAPVSLPEPAIAIEAGYGHSCAVLQSGKLYCWGENAETQLGQADAPDENSFVPLLVPVPSRVVAVGAGQGHTVALLASGEVAAWGRNSAGEVGLGDAQPARIRVPTVIPSFAGVVALDVGQDSAVTLDAKGELFCWGAGTDQHLGTQNETTLWSPSRVDLGSVWRSVSTDTLHSCGIDEQSRLSCWGRGIEGQLGAGNFDRLQPVPKPVTEPGPWKIVSVGRFHTCAITAEDRLFCTGDNPDGELGTGDTVSRNVLTEIALP